MDDLDGQAGSQGVYWIDDEGQWHRVDPTSPYAHIREPIAKKQEPHAFRWLGMVRAELAPGETALKWDVPKVEPSSVEAAQAYLREVCPQRVRLEFFHGGWNVETFDDPREACERMKQIGQFRRVAILSPLTTVRVQPPLRPGLREDLQSKSMPLLDRACAAWEASERIWAPDRPLSWLDDDALIMEPPAPESDSMLVRHLGRNHTMASVTGRPPEGWTGVLCSFDWMSREQVARLIVAYHEVTRSGHPHMEDVRALVLPKDSEPSWIPYRRLLLPVHDGEGLPLVICFSEVRQDIGIPFMGRAA